MLNRMMGTILRTMVRVVVLLAGLVFVASALTVALFVLAVWLVRALWARLTGQPVQAWTFQVNRRAVWGRFYRAPKHDRSSPPSTSDDANVIDVEPKQIKPPER